MPTQKPRLNVTVTPEQHALLLELARLNGGSAAGYLRAMLDHATPLLRTTVPALRLAEEEMNLSRDKAREQLNEMFSALRNAGVDFDQFDLLDDTKDAPLASPEPQRSEDGRAKGARSDQS